MPQRHSKNAGTMGVEAFTYAERKALGFGTVTERLGKDAQGNFYDCNLTMAPAEDPMCTPGGFLFSKRAILENLLAQKRANKRKLQAWEEQESGARLDSEERAAAEREAQVEAFDRKNRLGSSGGGTSSSSPLAGTTAKGGVSSAFATAEEKERAAGMKAFWLPSKTPAADRKVDKPSMDCICPASGKKLRLKDLFALRFTRDPDPSPSSSVPQYIDPVTKDALTNKDKLVALRATGDVMKRATFEMVVKPEGAFRGHKVRPKDVVEIQSGGTGFAARDKHAQAKKKYLVGMGSGLADLRGQTQGPGSRFGLQFHN